MGGVPGGPSGGAGRWAAVGREAEGEIALDAARLWAASRKGDRAARCALIERYSPLATAIARRMRVPTCAVTGRDDLESAGLVGLIDAVDRFEPERGIPFEAYATLRIRGAILDELRRLDDRSRGERRRTREAEAAMDPADAAVAAYASITLSLDHLLERGGPAWPAEDELGERWDLEDLRMRVQSALTCLPQRQRELLARYYGDALTLREAGARMGISEARACQLHGRAIQNLRRQLAVVVPPQHAPPQFAPAA